MPTKGRKRLSDQVYAAVRSAALRRDGWRCQRCGARSQLDVHHLRFRAHGGDDTLDNLIVLCRKCHQCVHDAG